MTMMAAIAEKRSTHIEMSVTGGWGAGGRPDVYVAASSSRTDSSAISTNSISNIFFTTLGGRQAAGLYGPAFNRAAEEHDVPGAVAVGTVTVGDDDTFGVATTAAASRSNPDMGRETKKIGRLSIADMAEDEAPEIGWDGGGHRDGLQRQEISQHYEMRAAHPSVQWVATQSSPAMVTVRGKLAL